MRAARRSNSCSGLAIGASIRFRFYCPVSAARRCCCWQIALFVGGIGTTLGQLASNIMAILGGAGLRKFNIVRI